MRKLKETVNSVAVSERDDEVLRLAGNIWSARKDGRELELVAAAHEEEALIAAAYKQDEKNRKDIEFQELVGRVQRGENIPASTPMIAEANKYVEELRKPPDARESGEALERQIASLENELIKSMEARAPKGTIREELRHKMSREDLARACLSSDFENKLRALKIILSSEEVSEMGRTEILALANDILNTGLNIGIAITRANNLVGEEIEAHVQRVRSEKGVESKAKKSKQMDDEIWEKIKPYVSVDKYATENIRKIRRGGIFRRVIEAGIEKELVGDDRLSRVMNERLYPQKRRLNKKNK